ncbi:MAG: hypothetical protein ACYDGR_16135 [Candidatus Dormibacteria bacterium]
MSSRGRGSTVTVERTVDGGRTWGTVTDGPALDAIQAARGAPTGCDLNPPAFVNARRGWVTAS